MKLKNPQLTFFLLSNSHPKIKSEYIERLGLPPHERAEIMADVALVLLPRYVEECAIQEDMDEDFQNLS